MRTDARERPGGLAVGLLLLVLALLLSGGYAAAYAAAGDDVPRGTTVEGVEIGGRPPAEAVAALEAGLAERADGPIRIEVDDRVLRVDPADDFRVGPANVFECAPACGPFGTERDAELLSIQPAFCREQWRDNVATCPRWDG